ncbi:MAG: PaaI family thioesterase [Salaquimonas sp.]
MSDLHPIQMFFSSHHPLASKVNASFEGSVGGKVLIEIEALDSFIRDEKTRILHSGFATIILDSIMGGAVMGMLTKVQPIATIGLSMHHLRKPVAGEHISGHAHCTAIYNDVAYVTGELHDQNGEAIAIANGTFMIGTRGTSIREKASNDHKVGSRI